MRLLLSPKWMGWHVLTLGAMVTCGWLAVWQWARAGSAMGSALNVGYGLQWPLFAVFFGVMWWRFLRMEINELRAREAVGEPGDATPAGDAGGTPRRDRAADSFPATAGSRTVGGDVALREHPAPAAPAPRASPFTARPAGATAPRGTDPQLRAYNDELARLAARHQEETAS